MQREVNRRMRSIGESASIIEEVVVVKLDFGVMLKSSTMGTAWVRGSRANIFDQLGRRRWICHRDGIRQRTNTQTLEIPIAPKIGKAAAMPGTGVRRSGLVTIGWSCGCG